MTSAMFHFAAETPAATISKPCLYLCWHPVHQGELHCFPMPGLNSKSRRLASQKDSMSL
jgi:hypothetical protein